MKRRDTHIDSLLERLKEPRVQQVIEPMLYGGDAVADPLSDDSKFCLDLGLASVNPAGGLRPANPIYREVMVRTLGYRTQMALPESLAGRWMDGKRLDMTALLKAFQQFWRENAAIWMEGYEYKEAAPQLILQAFLQRVVNGGARITREMAVGRGRVDVCVQYAGESYPVELKLAGRGAGKRGLEQTAEYMDAFGAKVGWLLIFDRNPKKPWSKKITWSTEKLADGKIIHVVGC
jgi:hypothetical protein